MDTYGFTKIMGGISVTRIRLVYIEWARRHGLSYNVLAVLYTAYNNDGCTQKSICREWGLTKQTANNTCMSLKRSGIITQTQGTKDKREMNIHLTEKGLAFATPIIRGLLEIESRCISRLGENAEKLVELYVDYAEKFETEFAKSTTPSAAPKRDYGKEGKNGT
ncbi:MAG: MarR family transcriptional regulator [Clostridia bacterium]|nr:MarR family transcriptional regulator [Clostridia bacterium]